MQAGFNHPLVLATLLPAPAAQTEQAVILAGRSVHCGSDIEVAVFESGIAYQQVNELCATPQWESSVRHVGADQVQELLEVAHKTRFVDLPPSIIPKLFGADEDVLTTPVRIRGREGTANAVGLQRATDPASAERFLRLWLAIGKLGGPELK